MDIPKQSRADRYESFYREFDSPLMQKIRRETFGEDIGLHSWGSAQTLHASTFPHPAGSLILVAAPAVH